MANTSMIIVTRKTSKNRLKFNGYYMGLRVRSIEARYNSLEKGKDYLIHCSYRGVVNGVMEIKINKFKEV